MCVWSAYAGCREAAPVLWESLNKIEGIWGGFYTGLVTMDENGLHWEKCVGNTDAWRRQYRLEDFPGSSGLIHSRTASGGDAHRAHPFIGANGIVALVAQGASGIFDDNTQAFTDCAKAMLARGRKCRSAIPAKAARSFALTDGTCASMSDIVANAVEEQYLQHGDPVRAMKDACSPLPEESATIFLFRDRPGFIGFVNVNQHVVCDFEQDGVWLSVSRIGVPGLGFEIPGNSVGYVTAEGEQHREPLGPRYQSIDTRIPGGSLDAFRDYLQKHPRVQLSEICDNALAPLFPHEMLEYRAVTAYNVLETLYFSGHIRMEAVEHENWADPEPGKIFLISWQ